MTKLRKNGSPLRGHAVPLLAAVASLVAVILLGGTRLLPTLSGSAAPAPLASSSVIYVPAGAHASGANGASWRTDVQVHNYGTGTASFTIQLLKRDADNGSPQSKTYTLGAQQSRRFADALMSEFGFDGAAALRVIVSAGSLVVTSRTYNFVGANPWSLPVGASFGQFVPGVAETEGIGYGQEGRLIQLTQQTASSLNGFRTNIGIVNTTAIPIDVRLDLYRSDGTLLGTKSGGETNLPPYGFRQLNEVFSAWGTVADGWAVVKTTTPGGGLFSFATVIDNHNSGDPIFIPAVRLAGSGSAPTPTPTVPSTSGGDLAPYTPEGWQYPVVPDYQPGSKTSEFLSAHMNTYVRWAVANYGPANIAGPIHFELRIDGTRYTGWVTSTGLQAGYYTYVEDFLIPYDTLSVGTHTLTIVADYDNAVSEPNESNNSWLGSWDWTSIVFKPEGARTSPSARPAEPVDRPLASARPMASARGGPSPAPLAAAAGTIYVPASAHASGVNGASWRTDVEVHNPGTSAVSFQVALLPQATDNGGSPPTRTFSLGPQQSVRYVDILSSVFGTSGAAAMRFLPSSGSILVNSRTYNLIGSNGVGLPVGASFGQFVPGLDENAAAIAYGEEGRLVQLTHRDASSYTDFRTNIGYANTTASPIDLRIDLYSAAGSLLATIQDSRTHLRAYESTQINAVFGACTSWLADGYAVIRTVTPGGRFLAFATVIDNHLTGDPIFVPAVKMAGSAAPPTPTPTTPVGPTATPTNPPPGPTPTPATDTITGIEILNGAMTGLGHSGSGTINIADIANTAKSNGLDAALTQIANASGQHLVTKSGNGLVVNYGSGYHAKDGTTYTGSGTITTSSFNVSGNHVTWHGVVTSSNIKRDGKPLGTGTGNITVDYTASGSTVVGDISGSVTSTSNPGSSASGSAHIDTSICPKYPISGTITATQAGKTSTATFTQACDGSYTYSGPALSSSGYELSIKKCDGTYRTDYPYFKIAVVEAGGSITKDPACGNKSILGFTSIRVWGKTTNTSVTLSFAFDLGGSGGVSLHHYAGVFTGTRSAPGVPVFGTTTYTVSVPQNGCSNAFSESGNSKLLPKAAGCSY